MGWTAAERRLYAYKHTAKWRRKPWGLADEAALNLFAGACDYCGADAPPERPNGIDRVDNSLGYVPGNVVSCCRICNMAKRSMGRATFEAWITRAAAHIASRGVV